ncbi:hypothetical protein C815_02280 [Firmicutes bacterium M10-2]|nr:hypothetical protein C815_02280 [Firmicutes bacterium M10-2]
MKNNELICFQLISNAGMAKSAFVEAIRAAEEEKFELANQKMSEGKEFLIQGHTVHASVIQKEAAGEKTETSLLLIHAEDQLMSAEMTELLANTIIAQAKKIKELSSLR